MPCPGAGASQFSCITLTVPLDHFAPGTARTDVSFAIRRHTAPGDARGVLVTALEPAGTSGIANADAVAQELGAAVRARWDIVVMDRRGVGRSGGLACPDAARAWITTDATSIGAGTAGAPTGTDAALIAAARTFSDDCVAEAGVDPATLRFLGTRHAAEDIEALRRYLAQDQLTLFGAADGGTLLQQYAAQHPDAVRALLLDAPMDPGTDGVDAWLESARAYENTLAATLLDCTTTPACARDVRGGDASAAYDQLARTLAQGPVTVNVPGADGKDADTAFTLSDLGAVAAAYVTTEQDRMLLQRAIAAATQDRWWPLARLRAVVQAGTADASVASRIAIRCADLGLLPGSGDPAAEWLRIGRENGTAAARLGQVWATDLPCATWPAGPDPDVPLATVDEPPFPVVVMGATLDPVTPWAGGERVARRAGPRRAHTILTAGGPHLTYGRGRQCPDRAITSYLVVGREPSARGSCTGAVAAAYVPLGTAARSKVKGTREALASADREITASADRLAWDGRGELRFGCPGGGWIAFSPGSGQADLALRSCAFTEGVPLTGTGSIVAGSGALALDLDGGAGDGTVSYRRSGRGEVTLSGRLAILD